MPSLPVMIGGDGIVISLSLFYEFSDFRNNATDRKCCEGFFTTIHQASCDGMG
jgi:hypothetical protein